MVGPQSAEPGFLARGCLENESSAVPGRLRARAQQRRGQFGMPRQVEHVARREPLARIREAPDALRDLMHEWTNTVCTGRSVQNASSEVAQMTTRPVPTERCTIAGAPSSNLAITPESPRTLSNR